MPEPAPHPAQRFRAPSTIPAGWPLKRLLDRRAAALIGESFAAVVPGFDAGRFAAAAVRGCAPLALMARGARFAEALAAQLPDDFARAAPLLVAALGPPLPATAGNGLAPFFYLPHSCFIAARGATAPDAALAAIRELTRRFTGEFAIRPLLIAHPGRGLAELARWARDADPHVRRLASEGSRPRLPWGLRLRAFQRDPAPLLPLLEALKDDDDLYVRRSVANHLGDIAKDNPDIAFARCARWLAEARRLPAERAQARRWIIRHAVRLPARQGVAAAVRLRREAGGAG